MKEKNNSEYLNEDKYKKVVRILNILGFVFVGTFAISLIFLIITLSRGSVSMGVSGWFEAETARNFGIFGSAVGMMISAALAINCFVMANRRKINAFIAQQNLPVGTETINKTVKGITPAIKDVTDTVATSIKNAKISRKHCKFCGKEIDENSVYCSYCGKNLQ